MIKELILDNDRVVLPGLGCFVAEMVPATFSDKGYTINPPYRRLYFRAKPDTDDSLVNFYAETNGLDRGVACRILGEFIAELRTIIYTKKLVVLPGLGRLRATKENNIFFIPDEDLDIYPAGFGLEPISLKTHKETAQEVSAAVVGLRSILDDVVPVAGPVKEPVPAAEQPVEPVTESAETVAETAEADAEAAEPAEAVEPAEPVGALAEAAAEPAETVELAEPVAGPAEVVQPEPETTVESEPAVEIEPIAEPKEVVPVAEPSPEPAPQSEPMNELAPEAVAVKKPVWKKLLVLAGVLVALAVILLIAFVVVARVAPEWLDTILYTPEELEILNRTI